ncbi:MAG: hypothetical protein ABTQ34_08725 [Bdellovibrionales bacterium]
MKKNIHAPNQIIHVCDKMQNGYAYNLVEPIGKNFAPDFKPNFSPQEMLALGIFEGKYCNDCQNEFPANWFEHAKISATPDPSMNYFKIKSRLPLSQWQRKGWIFGPDPRGWFQWYCRYYLGRRIEDIDALQIKRWKAFARHSAQIRANCMPHALNCRPRQRQALLQWSWNPFD